MGKPSKVTVMHSHGRQTNRRVHTIKTMKTVVQVFKQNKIASLLRVVAQKIRD
uniref:Uncharacterized protein n=1 Tax=Arundo donax TaxID=35708 RepID=A0A0A9BN15_ARUDO